MKHLYPRTDTFILVAFLALLLISLASFAQSTITVDESNVGGDIIGGNQTNINIPEPKSLTELITGSWTLMSYTHRPVVDGSQNDMFEPAFRIKEGNGTLNVSETGRFVWKVTVHDNSTREQNDRIIINSTAQIKPNKILSPIRGGDHNSTTYPPGARWQHNMAETSLSIMGWNNFASDAFKVTTDSDGIFLEMKNKRSEFVWARD